MIHDKVEIYSKKGCPYCDLALERAHSYFSNIIVYSLENGDYTKEELKNKIPFKYQKERLTVPQIFVNDEYVGGYEEFYIFTFKNVLGDFS